MADSVEPDQVVDADVVESTEIARQEPTASGTALFATDDPMEIMRRTSEVASALKAFVVEQKLVSQISGRDYILVEGWQMLGMMLGVTPGKVVTTEITAEREADRGWESVVELLDRSGRVVGAGEAVCLRSERSWKARDTYALKSMAQTRAIGKAYRNTFGFIAKAAGYEATPAEEMPGKPPFHEEAQVEDTQPVRVVLSPRGQARVRSLIEGAGLDVAEVVKEARVASGKLEDVDAIALPTIEAIVETRQKEREDAEREAQVEA